MLQSGKASDDDEHPETWAETLKDARRERILTAAAQVFEERGLDEASMRKIATQAGCTTGAIYPLFKSKEAMYAELLSRSLDDLRRRMDAVDPELSPTERVRVCARIIMDFYLEKPSEFALSFYLSAGLKRKGVGSELNSVLNDRLAEIRRVAEKDFAACIGPERAAEATTGLFAHLTGLLVLQLRGRFRVFAGEPRDLLRTYLDAVLGPDHEPQGEI